MMDTSTLLKTILVIALGAGFLIFITYGFFFVIVPYWLRCPKCTIHLASVKVRDVSSLSSQQYAAAGANVLYGGKHVCSVCWESLRELGFSTDGNWAPGTIMEYLKTTPNFIAVLISVGALVVSVIALLG